MSGRCPAVLGKGGGTPLKKILIIKATCDPRLLSGAQRHWGKLFSEPKQNLCDPQDTSASSH